VLFRNISLSIDNEKVGLIGINGTGKSTLLKIIAGIETSETGTIQMTSGTKIEYLPQNPDFDENSTVLEQVFKGESVALKTISRYQKTIEDLEKTPGDENILNNLYQLNDEMNALNAWDMERQVKTILTKLGVQDFNKKINTLSGGQKKRTALASALVSPCDLLILDEPTNHLDHKMIDWLETHIKGRKGSLLMITHDRYFLDRAVGKIIELDEGRLFIYEGNYSYFVEKKIERQDLESSLDRKKNSLYKKELAWMRKGAKARTTKQKARIQRFEVLSDSRVLNDDTELEITAAHSRLGQKIIELDNVSKSFGNEEIIKNYTYTFQRDDRIGIIGDNGAGKSTLLNLITGKITPDKGSISIGETVNIAYFSQQSEDMDTSLRAIEYIKESAEFVTTADGYKISASQMMEKFLFPSSLQWSLISKLSGGERRRLYLMKILMLAPNVLVLDEPTNDLDIDTLKVLESYIDDFNGPVITVSHDRYFLDRICNKILDFEGSSVITQHTGNYFDYLEEQESEITRKSGGVDKKIETPIEVGEDVGNGKKTKAKVKLSYNEQKEFNGIDADIEKLENEIEIISEEICLSNSDFEKLQTLTMKRDTLEEELLVKMERQEYLIDLVRQIQLNC